MPTGGLLIYLRNEHTLPLYLAHGVYGPAVPTDHNYDPFPEPYIEALADVGCPRRDDHVFFLSNHRLHYGGRIVGESEQHPIYLNGNRGFVGKASDSPLAWDETRWDAFAPPGCEGRNWRYRPARCQPFLLRFADHLGLRGRWICDHDYYVALGDHHHLLPTTDELSGLTQMSPGETDRLLALLTERPAGRLDPPVDEEIAFVDEPLAYDPAFGPTLADVVTPDDLVAVALVNPTELPEPLRQRGTVGHHVPISPHRPRPIDRVELASYTDRRLLDGTLPDHLVYLSLEPADHELHERIGRQFTWLERLLGDDVSGVDRAVGAPGLAPGFEPEQDNDRTLERVTWSETG